MREFISKIVLISVCHAGRTFLCWVNSFFSVDNTICSKANEKEDNVTKSNLTEKSDHRNSDLIHLYQALDLAKIRRGFCAPNPSVGSVIINQSGEVIATGYHFAAGAPHAEIVALDNLTDRSEALNATIYVTLEPCCHWGKTPPCTDVLINAGVKRVVYGYSDPNSAVAGKGALALQKEGIICDYLPIPEIQSFYLSYAHWLLTKKPFVTAKIAMTLNGKIAGKNNEPIQITGEALQNFTHYSRKNSDAILTTADTIFYDDPELNARYQDEVFAKPIYILDSKLRTLPSARIFSTAKSITLFHGNNPNLENQAQLLKLGVRCIEINKTKKGLSLQQVLFQIGNEGVQDLWVEAGGVLFSTLLTEQLLQRAFIYIAPKWINDGKSAFSTDFSFAEGEQLVCWEQIGNDVLCELRW
jgi:diaminohydroxyphosphoribosylaminopyrimidine deaminase/5-amino-6-(5-phosphoribosylamino)uracil reductase